MGFRASMRVLDPAPTGAQSIAQGTMRRGSLQPAQQQAAPLHEHFLSSYSQSFANPTGTLARAGMGALGRSSSSPLLQAKKHPLGLPIAVAAQSMTPARPAGSNSPSGQPLSRPPSKPMLQQAESAIDRVAGGGPVSSFDLHNHEGATAAQQRALLELLGSPVLKKAAQQIFQAHDTEKIGSLSFEDLRAALERLHTELGLHEMDTNKVERMFKKYDVRHDQRLDFEEFFDLLLSLLRREAFSRRDVITREFFVTKSRSKVWDDFVKVSKLGSGTFGTAYLAKKNNGEERVVKAVKKSRVKIPVEDVEREIMVMRQVDHPHIVRLFRWYEDKRYVYLILEALKGGTLKDVVLDFQKRRVGLKEDWIREVTRQCCSALAYCHSLRLIHKDIKDENIMLLKKEDRYDKPFAVIIDLGVAEMFALSDPQGRECGGTPVTMAPEVWSNCFGPKCDVWSVGCVVFELLSGNFPFVATSMKPEAWIKLHKRGPDWTLCKTSTASKSCCKAMLTFNEEYRPTMMEILQHEWFVTPQREMRTVTSHQFMGLQNFANESSLKRALLLDIAARLPMDRATEIVDVFEGVDKDGDGRVTRGELSKFFSEMGINDAALVDRVFKSMDVDQSGELSFSEFASGLLVVFKDVLEDRLDSMINEYDKDRDGFIDKEQLSEMMQGVAAALGGDHADEVLKEVLAEAGSEKQSFKRTDLKERVFLSPKKPSASPAGSHRGSRQNQRASRPHV